MEKIIDRMIAKYGYENRKVVFICRIYEILNK